jgi:hypothetical protein
MFKLGYREGSEVTFVEYEGGKPLELDTREQANNYLRFLMTCIKGYFSCLEVIEVNDKGRK